MKSEKVATAPHRKERAEVRPKVVQGGDIAPTLQRLQREANATLEEY